MLLAGLDPILQVGIARALYDGGAEVIGDDADPDADTLVLRAGDLAPNAIVLGEVPSATPGLGARLREAVPLATIVLWRSDAHVVAVLVPGESAARVTPAPTAEQLSRELFGYSGKGATCPST